MIAPATVAAELAAWNRFYECLWALREATGETWPAGWYETCAAAWDGRETEAKQLEMRLSA